MLDAMWKARTLSQATQFTAVGYGFLGYETGPGGQLRVSGQRTRRYAASSFDALTPSYLHLSQNAATGDGGTCAGDSGGPSYLGAGEKETDVIAGITVTGDVYCKATNVPLRVDTKISRDFLANFVAVPGRGLLPSRIRDDDSARVRYPGATSGGQDRRGAV